MSANTSPKPQRSFSVIRRCSSIDEERLLRLEKQLSYRRSLGGSDIARFMGSAVAQNIEVELASARQIKAIKDLGVKKPNSAPMRAFLSGNGLNVSRGFYTLPLEAESADGQKALSFATDQELKHAGYQPSNGFTTERMIVMQAWARECGVLPSQDKSVLEEVTIKPEVRFATSNGPMDDKIIGQLCDNPALFRYALGDVVEFSPPEIRYEAVQPI